MGSPGPAATGSHRQPPGPRCSGRPSLQEMRTVPKRGPIPPRPEPGSSRPVPLPAPQLGEPRPATQRSRRGPSGLTPRAVQLRPHAAPSQLEIPTRHRTPKIPSAVPGGTRTGQDRSGLTAADTARTAAVPCAPPRAAPEARTPPASRDRRAPQGLERSCTCANAAPPASRFPPPSSLLQLAHAPLLLARGRPLEARGGARVRAVVSEGSVEVRRFRRLTDRAALPAPLE